MLRKQELVGQLNELLGMENKLTHWQFTQIRSYELREMVGRIYSLRQQLDEYKEKFEAYEITFSNLDAYGKDNR